MKHSKWALAAAIVIGSWLPATPASAAGIYCSSVGGNASGLNYDDVTFRGNNADDCHGIVLDNITANGNGGNDGPTEVTSYFSGAAYGTGDFLGFASGGSALVAGPTTFSLAHTGANTASGTWTLTATGGLPGTFDIVLALKASNRYATYFFNDEFFAPTDSGNGQLGAWEITFLNNGGEIPNISHIVGFVRNGTDGSGSGSGQAAVPEPATLLLMGTGLSLAAYRGRRAKKAQK